MSAIASVESFQTAAESLSPVSNTETQSPALDAHRNGGTDRIDTRADTDGDVCNRHHEKNAGIPSTNISKQPSRSPYMQDETVPSRRETKNSNSYTESTRKRRSATSPEQAGVIDTLIESLNTSRTSLGNGYIRRSGAYSLEPLEQNCTINSAESRHSRRISSSLRGTGRDSNSSKSSQPRSSRGSGENITSNTLLQNTQDSQRPKSESIIRVPDDGVPRSSLSPGPDTDAGPEQSYPPKAKLAVILLSLYISIFLIALDRTILGPAIPEITNTFKSIKDIGWYGSAYMLTACGFILLYGRLYTFFSTKRVFLITIGLFEAGSAICGAAQSSKVFILGRAIAGVGSSGIYTGVMLIIVEIVPLKRRPLCQGLFGVCFGVASVAGPLLGGTFTGSSLTWRWCFYINLPLGVITIVAVFFLVRIPGKEKKMTWKETVRNLDPLGTLLFMPSIVSLLLALEWGSTRQHWNDPDIIGLLVAFAVLFTAFVGWQYATRNTTATVPTRIMKQRSVACGCVSQFGVGATMLTCALYIPLWFQAIKGDDAMQSGIRTIPLVLSVVVGAIFSGGAVQKIGYYTPFMIAGGIMLSVGAGLLTTWNVRSTNGAWIGYQALVGLGVGFTMQHPNLAIQIALPKQDLPTGTALLSLFQTLGGALFASVGQSLFLKHFLARLKNIRGIHLESVLEAGATELKNRVSGKDLVQVISAYNFALTQGPFLACLVVACFTVPAALGMEWFSVKDKDQNTTSANVSHPDEESANGSFKRSISNQSDQKPASEDAIPPPIPRDSARRNGHRMSREYPHALAERLNRDVKTDLEKCNP